ncbi:DUF1643 domain-containing protein [Streptomyces sp. NPDC060366]|uniref:DUF1643 domain-containing protein n=1 Tax=Streptomyces sp. NPDC060366 TaxID=3347105 RepID=UPI00365D7374
MKTPTLTRDHGLDVVVDVEDTVDGLAATAVFDTGRTYRYLLTRIWDPSLPLAVWLMLNPSTADALADDPTIRRCKTFSQDHGRGGLVVINLFALRATNPALLRHHPDPVGPHNASFVRQAVRESDLVIAAWGGGGVLANRGPDMARALAKAGVRLKALGVISNGQPKHPLYVAGGTPLVDYAPEGL